MKKLSLTYHLTGFILSIAFTLLSFSMFATLLNSFYPDCTIPTDLRLARTLENIVEISWQGKKPSRRTHFYQIRYRSDTTPSWTTIDEKSRTQLVVEDIFSDENYFFEIRKVCYANELDDNYFSDWVSASLQAADSRSVADSLCALLTYSEAQSYQTGIMVNWEGPEAQWGVHDYYVSYKQQGQSDWKQFHIAQGDQYYIPDLIDGAFYDVKIQLIISDGELNYTCDEIQLGPIQVIHVEPNDPEEEDPEITLPDFNCGDDFTPPDLSNTAPLPSAEADDIFFINGFPILLQVVAGGAGQFDGEGLLPLPFQGRTVKVEFSGVTVNKDYQITAGTVTGVYDNPANIPEIPSDPFYVGGDICQPLPDSTGFDENGLWQPGNEPYNPNTGFNANGTYAVQPPYPGYQEGDPFDPNYSPTGFDANGIHVTTGTAYDSLGCGQFGLTADGQPCNNSPSEPYWWLDPTNNPPTGGGIALGDTISDQLRDLIVTSLDSMLVEADDSIRTTELVCGSIRNDFTSSLSGFSETQMVEGKDQEFMKQGMYQNFSADPQVLPETSNSRTAEIIALEKNHVDLFNCDKRLHKYIYWKEILTNFRSVEGLDELEKDIMELVRRLPDTEAQNLMNDPVALLSWVFNQVDREVFKEMQSLHSDLLGYQQEFERLFNFNNSLQTPSFYQGDQMVSTAGRGIRIEDLSDAALEEIQYSFMQGHEYIGATHRAFYLQALAKSRHFTMTQANQNLMPITISKVVAGKEQIVYLDELILTPTSAKCNVYFILEPPSNGNKAVFKLEEVEFGPTGLPVGAPSKLLLVNDVGIRLTNAARLNFIGGENTYVSFDCEGFAGMSVEANIELCRNYVVPLDPLTMEVIPEDTVRVKAHFIAAMPAWGEFICELDIDPFALAKKEDVKFKVHGAKFDFSDKYSIDGINFPDNYVSPFVENNQVSPMWKGFYMSELSVTLPNKFAKDTTQSLTGGVRDMIIDGMGCSGRIFLTPVMPLDSGNVGGWAFSIDTFQLGIVSNRIKSGSIDGLINVPLIKSKESDSTSTAITPADCLVYDGTIDAENKYTFVVRPGPGYSVPIWKAEATLKPSSFVKINEEDGQFVARAKLDGVLAINTQFSASKSLNINDIKFEGVQVSSKAPHLKFGSWSLPGSIGADFGGFGITVHSPRIDSSAIDFPTIKFGVSLRLNENEEEEQESSSPSLTAGGFFSVRGEMVEENSRQRWQYKDFKVHEFCVEAGNVGVIKKLGGCLAFFDEEDWDNATVNWGSGFRGSLDAEFNLKKLQFGLSVIAQFGNIKTGDPYKYFMVDGMILSEDGISLGPLNMHGFGGGLTYNMARQSVLDGLPSSPPDPNSLPEIGTSLSGTQFLPDSKKSVGVFANTVMATQKKEAFNFNATLGAEFQDGGGFSSIYFQGNARFMSDMELSASTDYNPGNYKPNNGAEVNAFINLEMDFNSGIFDGAFDVFVNANEGRLIGAKDENRRYFGGCEMSFGSPDGWYINMGRPSARNVLKLRGSEDATSNLIFTSYLNIGTDIEPMPDPPAEITEMLGVGNFMANESARATGNGFAFGASLELATGDIDWLMFYASFTAKLGFDFNLQDYGTSVSCLNTGKPLGINGWYASGQAYAYFNGKIGIKISNSIRYEIIDLSAAAILQAKLPNPFWARATVGGSYSIMGGLHSGQCTFNVEIGKQCELEPGTDIIPEFPIYANFNPGDSERNFPTLGQPVVTFGLPVNKDFEELNSTFRLEVEYAKLETTTGVPIPVQLDYDDSGLNLTLVPLYELPGNDTIKLNINVLVFKDGNQVDEKEKEIVFQTAETLSTIPLSNISNSYPIHGQFNFYKAQNGLSVFPFAKGFIELKAGQPNLLLNVPEGKRLAIRIQRIGMGGALSNSYVSATTNFQGNRIDFQIPHTALVNGGYHSTALVFQDIPPGANNNNTNTNGLAGGGLDFGGNDAPSSRAGTSFIQERPFPKAMMTSYSSSSRGAGANPNPGPGTTNTNNHINMGEPPLDDLLVNFNFRVSTYNTFAEKMNAFFATAQGTQSDNHLGYTASNFEPFDYYESQTNDFGEPFVNVEWDKNYNTSIWFNDARNDFYNHFPNANVELKRSGDAAKEPSWATEIKSITSDSEVLVIRVPDYTSYLQLNDKSFNVSVNINPFRIYAQDVSQIKNELIAAVSGYMMTCPPNSPEDPNCDLFYEDIWNVFMPDPWLRLLYEGQLNFTTEPQNGNYRATIKYNAPQVNAYNFSKTFTKTQD